ncbi:MAG: nitrate reductase molybdenum cofactor assembly chaperone [Geobacteraceae bacterium]|nr:nitrate reductase molybdenum cofactor assembly chaperone [Geobacteraceae bacterium]
MKEYGLFAEIIDYPTPLLASRIEELRQLVSCRDGKAGECLGQFREFVVTNSPAMLEELYTATFDLQPLCYRYVGYQLFGEEYRRGLFMAGLREHYRACGFEAGDELPDQLCVILRFLAGRKPEAVEVELVSDCLIPSLEKMLTGFSTADNPYRHPLQALLRFLAGMAGNGESTEER